MGFSFLCSSCTGKCTQKTENKFSLCKVRKWIDKQPIWITKSYMKAFLTRKKSIANYGFFFPYVPHVQKVYKSENSSILIEFGIQYQKYLQDKLNLREHFTTFFVRSLDHSHWKFDKNIHSFHLNFPCWHWLRGCHLGKNWNIFMLPTTQNFIKACFILNKNHLDWVRVSPHYTAMLILKIGTYVHTRP